MEPRPCIVTTETGEYPGKVVAWWRERGEWWAVVTYRAPGPGGFILGYHRRLPASALRPRT